MTRQLFQRRNPVRCLWVRRKKVVVPVGVKRIDDEHVGGRRIALGWVVIDPLGQAFNPLER